ncbi:hypothetical protein BV898_02661 [Hypsibius exemplaris]|uniref:Uncharacterized protein n=1 Tax=Hypsibius exemplaris TaxID=2072580 RepID=A0A1W0X807_HYPEX|nr:hypothetical protein BV898_02661 [Hypsibius exemplaris]
MKQDCLIDAVLFYEDDKRQRCTVMVRSREELMDLNLMLEHFGDVYDRDSALQALNKLIELMGTKAGPPFDQA